MSRGLGGSGWDLLEGRLPSGHSVCWGRWTAWGSFLPVSLESHSVCTPRGFGGLPLSLASTLKGFPLHHEPLSAYWGLRRGFLDGHDFLGLRGAWVCRCVHVCMGADLWLTLPDPCAGPFPLHLSAPTLLP